MEGGLLLPFPWSGDGRESWIPCGTFYGKSLIIRDWCPPINVGVLLGAGSSTRFGDEELKQLAMLGGQTVLEHSLELMDSARVQEFVLLAPHEEVSRFRSVGKTDRLPKCQGVIPGGETRRDSVRIGLDQWSSMNVDGVFIHDVARPCVPEAVMDRLDQRFSSGAFSGVVPGLDVSDTVKKIRDKESNLVERTLDRSKLRRIQTPQLFDFTALYRVHDEWTKSNRVYDDAMMLEENGLEIGLVAGSPLSRKITFRKDLTVLEALLGAEPPQ